MLGNGNNLQLLVGARAPGDKRNLAAYLRALVKGGYAPVLIKPDDKLPLCPLSARTAQAEDRQAQAEAREAGNGNWQFVSHRCGIYHYLTAENILRHLENADKVWGLSTLNVALEVGKSNLLVVDVDTEAEVAAFKNDWESHTPDPYPGLTVSSPGVLKQLDGEDQPTWVHKGGGHIYFTIPDGVQLPEGSGTLKHNSWSVFYRSRYVLIPPSVRPEGPYKLTGTVSEAPGWLTDLISAEATPKDWKHLLAQLSLERALRG